MSNSTADDDEDCLKFAYGCCGRSKPREDESVLLMAPFVESEVIAKNQLPPLPIASRFHAREVRPFEGLAPSHRRHSIASVNIANQLRAAAGDVYPREACCKRDRYELPTDSPSSHLRFIAIDVVEADDSQHLTHCKADPNLFRNQASGPSTPMTNRSGLAREVDLCTPLSVETVLAPELRCAFEARRQRTASDVITSCASVRIRTPDSMASEMSPMAMFSGGAENVGGLVDSPKATPRLCGTIPRMPLEPTFRQIATPTKHEAPWYYNLFDENVPPLSSTRRDRHKQLYV